MSNSNPSPRPSPIPNPNPNPNPSPSPNPNPNPNPNQVLDISKAREVLGYVPAFNLSDMARTAWRWHAVQHEEFHGYAVSAESQGGS